MVRADSRRAPWERRSCRGLDRCRRGRRRGVSGSYAVKALRLIRRTLSTVRVQAASTKLSWWYGAGGFSPASEFNGAISHPFACVLLKQRGCYLCCCQFPRESQIERPWKHERSETLRRCVSKRVPASLRRLDRHRRSVPGVLFPTAVCNADVRRAPQVKRR